MNLWRRDIYFIWVTFLKSDLLNIICDEVGNKFGKY